MPNTVELLRDIRDRPARRLLAWGICLLAVGGGLGTIPSLVMTGRIDHTVWEYIHDITGPMFMTMRALGGIFIAGAVIVRVMLRSHEETRQELRNQAPGAEAIDRIVSLLDALAVSLSAHRERARHEVAQIRAEMDQFRAVRAEQVEETLREVLPDALKSAHAKGYVAGVEQRLNGTGGAVVRFEKP